MARISEESKQRNKEQLLMLIKRHHGLREKEIEDILHIHRRTLNNYLNELEREGKVYKDGLYWFADPQAGQWLRRFELTAAEAFALYLPARMFVKQSDKQNEIVLSALSRLAEVLKTDLPVDDQIFEAVQELRTREKRPSYESHFTDLIHAYLRRNPVTINYRSATGAEFQTTFHTYLVEPSAIGYTLYLIGYSQHVNDLRAYKIERITAVDVDHENNYEIPEEYLTPAFLKNAWSIISGESTERVLLHFNKKIKSRVLETNWHPDQKYDDTQADGSLLWWVNIASTIDMEPWIRGWGSDVEVIEPDHLRETIKVHVKRLAKTYQLTGLSTDKTSRLLLLWGKTSKQTELYHPALFHMIDVAHIAAQLLSPRATSRWRQVLGRTLDCDPNALHEWLPYIIALHDVGKLSTPFQMLNAKQLARLKDEKFTFGQTTPKDGQKDRFPHTIVGRLALQTFCSHWPKNLRIAFLDMVSGHHGIYQSEDRLTQQKYDLLEEPVEWQELRRTAIQLLESYFCQQLPNPLPNPENVSAAIVALNGFCILCDWLGSDETYFTPKPNTPLVEYIGLSRQKALARVESAGFFQTAVSQAPTTFTQLFNFPPRPLQQAIEAIPIQHLQKPTLTIIEAPAGEGKTEAALLLARRIAVERGNDELYIALPTTATSNAMHSRVLAHLHDQLNIQSDVQLIHGQSFLIKNDLTTTPLSNGDGEETAVENWFAPKKKALLAPFGVGTIDQAELAALNVKHNALRLIGLAGKTIILDEVHAYDTYMTTIIKRMVSWLSALGSSVILLSATLPTQKRKELIEAYSGKRATELDIETYPSLITINEDTLYTPTAAIEVFQSDKKITLEQLHFNDAQAAEKAKWLAAQVANGGCACWITNTVNRAQAIYRELVKDKDLDVILIHGRFPQTHRQALETAVLEKYGKNGNRPQQGIVIGTQVLEQSLDLDFDMMATDLAPIDLILQRAGRLHRHTRPIENRHHHSHPVLHLNLEIGEADKHIYGLYLLKMTEAALAQRDTITLPEDYRALVETVYTAPEPNAQDSELLAAWQVFESETFNLEVEADERLQNPPLPNRIFHKVENKRQGFKEDEDSNAWIVAQTRWGQESIAVIPVIRIGDAVQLPWRSEATVISLHQPAERDQQLLLMRYAIRISRQSIIHALKTEKMETAYTLFAKGLLKNCYPLFMEQLSDLTDVYMAHTLSEPVYLHPKLGLVLGEL